VIVVERLEARLGFADPVLRRAQPRRGVDQRLIELAPVLADGVDFLLEPGLGLGRLALLRTDRLKLPVALAQRVDRGL
jgi:hypothetical protein